MSELTRYNRFIECLSGGCIDYDFADKCNCIKRHTAYMLNRTQSMFKWTGLPSTITERVLELMLQINGNVGIAHVDGNLYAFCGGMGGVPDVYYMPTEYIVANPALKLNKSFKINEDIIVIPNDSCYQGLMPLFDKYASAMTETELSMKIGIVNSRIIDFITAPDDDSQKAALKFLADIEAGKPGVLGSNEFLGGIKVQPAAASGTHTLTDLIEMEQYLKASWYNDLGLNANYNMKRESINSGESQLNNDALLPLVDNMLKMRQIGAEKVNDMFGTNISVEFDSSWEDNVEEIAAEQDALDAESELEEVIDDEIKESVSPD